MSNKALIAIVGPSGTGKSTSLRNLNAETTKLIDLECKGFPFRGFEKFSIATCPSMQEADKAIGEALADKKWDFIVIDSFTKYAEYVMSVAKQTQKGYDIYNYFNSKIRKFLDGLKNDHAAIAITAIDEIVKVPQADGTELAQRRIYVNGKEHEGKIEKEMLMVFFTETKKDPKTGLITYWFRTNTDGVCSAKTPMEMFAEILIPNDLQAAKDAAVKYYTK